MKISEGLVFDKYTGELIGFTDLGDGEINEARLQKEKTLATHALLFLVRGISSDLKFPLAYFARDGVTSTYILPFFWRCIAILELNCKLCVIATICDGATPNRKFFRLHKSLDCCTDNEVVYRTINVFDRTRFIFFFSDPCHLIKTARNCMFNAGFFFYKILKTTSNAINLTLPIIAEKDTRSSSFHYEWHLQYKLVSIYKGTQVAHTILLSLFT